MTRSIAVVSLIHGLLCGLFGQSATAPPAFEVASIKPSAPIPGPNDRSAFVSHGRYTATGVNLRALLGTLHHIEGYQVSGGPRWLGEARYDITAKGDENATDEQVGLMIQTLLADRFKLAFHRETKGLPVYVLVIDKNGLKMKQSAPGTQYSLSDARSGQWSASKMPMLRLTRALTRELGRTVVDRTGLTGNYDFRLDWTPDQNAPAGPDGVAVSDSRRSSSIFTAVRDQLGLKLEYRKKFPIEMLIVDHVERPSEN